MTATERSFELTVGVADTNGYPLHAHGAYGDVRGVLLHAALEGAAQGGIRLFDALFQGEIGRSYRAYQTTRVPGEIMRVALRLADGAGVLAHLPWDTLRAPPLSVIVELIAVTPRPIPGTVIQGNQTGIGGDVSGPVLPGTFYGPVTFNYQGVQPATELRPRATENEQVVQIINDGLHALRERMSDPAVYSAVVGGHQHFANAISKLPALQCYKHLHDCFHTLEDRLSVLNDARRDLARDARDWRSAKRGEPDVYEALDDILSNAANSSAILGTTIWQPRLTSAQLALRRSVEERDQTKLNWALAQIDGVLGKELGQLNTRLLGVVRSLPLEALQQSLWRIQECLAAQSLDEIGHWQRNQINQINQAINALSQLSERLVHLVAEHDIFQQIDDELRVLDHGLEQGWAHLAIVWPAIVDLQNTVCAQNTAEWAVRLLNSTAELAQLIQTTDATQVEDQLWRYQSQVKRIFSQTDHDILSSCGQLQQIAPVLEFVFSTAT
jgi:hypothetical protein